MWTGTKIHYQQTLISTDIYETIRSSHQSFVTLFFVALAIFTRHARDSIWQTAYHDSLSCQVFI